MDVHRVFSLMLIVKALFNFSSRFWQPVVRTQIWLTHVDNTLMPDHAILIASIINGYDI